jgi:hypothetical protein
MRWTDSLSVDSCEDSNFNQHSKCHDFRFKIEGEMRQLSELLTELTQ